MPQTGAWASDLLSREDIHGQYEVIIAAVGGQAGKTLRAILSIEEGHSLRFEVKKAAKTYETQNLSEAIREFNREN